MRIRVFHRRLDIAQDDIYLPSSIAVLFRVIWISILLIAFLNTPTCDYRAIGGYVICHLVINGVCLFIETTLTILSMKGSVSDQRPTRLITVLTHVEIIWLVLDYLVQIYGFYVSFAPEPLKLLETCNARLSLPFVKIIVIWAFIVDTFFFLVLGTLFYLSRPNRPVRSDMNSYLMLWRRRLEWLISSHAHRTGDGQKVISDVSSLLARFFQGVDWAPSDVAVGLILLKREQKLLRKVVEIGKRRNRNSFWEDLFNEPNAALKGEPEVILVENDQLDLDPEIPDQIIHIEELSSPSKSGVSIVEPVVDVEEISSILKVVEEPKILHIGENIKRTPNMIKVVLPSEGLSIQTQSLKINTKNTMLKSATHRDAFKSRSKSSANIDFDKKREWSFAGLGFDTSNNKKQMRRNEILDVMHFCHYANMAYVKLDNEIQKKTDILLYFNPLNDLFQAPYMVSIDHDWSAIVVAIRGTSSASDVLVDLKIESIALDSDLENSESYRVHAGFYQTAVNIVDDMMNHKILQMPQGSREKDYRVVVCGHSLGAAVASIVVYLLVKKGYKTAVCYGYSMPGGVVSAKAAALFNDFCLAMVMGDDLVSRLTLGALDTLKSDVSRLIDRCKLSKYQIFGSAIGNQICLGRSESRRSLLKRTMNGAIPEGASKEAQDGEIERIKETTASLPRAWRDGHISATYHTEVEPMFMPGRILYVEKLRIAEPPKRDPPLLSPGEKERRGMASLAKVTQALSDGIVIAKYRSFDSKYVYTPRWATMYEFQEIIVSRTMSRDHTTIFGLMKEFESLGPGAPLSALS